MNEENMLKNQENLNTSPQYAHESNTLGKLFEALAKAQLDMEVAKTESINQFFKSKYSDLATIVKASRPALAKNGLSIIQRVLPNDKGFLHLFTRLCHSSGEWIESKMPILPPKSDIQTIASYITHIRRYSYASIAGVVASDEDDDGEKAMEAPRQQGIAISAPLGNISKPQLQMLSMELEGYPEIVEQVLKGFKISKLSDLPEKRYTKCIERIREIKQAKES